MIAKCFHDLGNDLVLFGTTKIFMRNKALIIIEKKFQEKVVLQFFWKNIKF